ncbi:MAG: cytochrome c [Acetobacteraceae bacterium]|nr:cytochrome c [Acetobacteraceae bacterium]
MAFSRRFARSLGSSALAAWCGLALGARAAQPGDPHGEALALLAAIQATVGQVVQSEDSFSTDPAAYRDAAQRAINMLVGTGDPLYVAAAGAPADPAGAIGRLDGLLSSADDQAWVPALRGAEVNLRAAVARLQTAHAAHELMDYQIAATQALSSLGTALGRGDDASVLGGLLGALASTALGVPQGAREVDACAQLSGAAPAYGTHAGYLAYIAVPVAAGTHALADAVTATAVTVQGGAVVLSTPAAALVAHLCATEAPPPPPAAPASHGAAKPPASSPKRAEGTLPALYTLAQAAAGQRIYMEQCVSCHGANLHGVAAPPVAGTEFLKTAEDNNWTLEVIRYLVFTMMPLNAGGSLQPPQYADLMAFLLASNCYPAGSTAFPEADQPSFADVQLKPLPNPRPNQNALGVCPVG